MLVVVVVVVVVVMGLDNFLSSCQIERRREKSLVNSKRASRRAFEPDWAPGSISA
jgi:hypothetical protein